MALGAGLHEALLIMKEEGREQIFALHARFAQATRAGIKTLGIELLTKKPQAMLLPVF